MPNWINAISPVNDGEPVNQAVTNRSISVLDNNVRYLKSIVDSGVNAGPAIVASNQPLHPATVVGTPVWYNGATARYEPAQATAVQDPATSALVLGLTANCVGVVCSKVTSTSGGVLLAGRYALDVSPAVQGGSVPAGRYYLSATVAGQLTPVRPPITVSVLFADGSGNVHVLPQIRDFLLGDHTHYSFNLTALPAGAVTPPVLGAQHTISSPNTTVKGWLPASNSIFNGLAPAGAAFGYNVSADPVLSAVWPPVPVSAYSVQVYKFNGAAVVDYTTTATLQFDIGAQGAQSFGPQGTQSQGPIGAQDSWELSVPLVQAQVGDEAFAEPSVELPPDVIWSAYVVTPGYVTVRIGTLRGRPTLVGAIPWTVGVTKVSGGGIPVNPVGLVTADANGIWWMSACYGDAPWPTLLNTSASPPAPVVCPRDNTQMAINLAFSRLTFGNNQPQVSSLTPAAGSPITVVDQTGAPNTAGSLKLGLNLRRELTAQVAAVTGVTEVTSAGFHYWRFPAGAVGTVKCQVDVPTLYLGAGPTVQLRLRLYGVSAGTLGNLSLSYRRLPRPVAVGTPLTPPAAPAALGLITAYAVGTGQYVDVLSSALAVAAGDTVVFDLTRNIGDGYGGDVGLVVAQGVLVGT